MAVGEGDAEAAAQAMPVTVRIKDDGSAGFLTQASLVITARDDRGKGIASRSMTGRVVPHQGSVAIEARRNPQVKRATLSLACGA